MRNAIVFVLFVAALFCAGAAAAQQSERFQESMFRTGALPPVASELRVKVSDAMPDFDLPTIGGRRVSLRSLRGRPFVLSFIPAAWTPVCSGQWPGYNIAQELFEQFNTALVGVSTDNVPSLFAWVTQMGGLWFPVASDFWPHGGLASKLGILRPEGVAERSLFLVDAAGVIRYIHVNDINTRPDLGDLIKAMKGL